MELYDKVGELVDCPVCLETMTKEKTAIPLCGHLICKECKENISVCPICRGKYHDSESESESIKKETVPPSENIQRKQFLGFFV